MWRDDMQYLVWTSKDSYIAYMLERLTTNKLYEVECCILHQWLRPDAWWWTKTKKGSVLTSKRLVDFLIINVRTPNSVESFTQIERNFTTHESHILEIMDRNLLHCSTFVILSDLVMIALSILEMNLLSANMNMSVERSPAISRWTALVVKQISRATYILGLAWLDLVPLEILMWYEPN